MRNGRSALDIRRSALGVRRFLFFSFLATTLIVTLAFAQNPDPPTTGYGPPTALPPDFSLTRPTSRPKQNWIDQSQAAADAKSAGCNQCHAGIEPMHQASHVVLGCTDCHGGNPARGLTKEQAHIQPKNK